MLVEFGCVACHCCIPLGGALTRRCSTTASVFRSIGPYITTDLTSQRIRDGLNIITRINGEVRGTGTTAKFRHTVERVVSPRVLSHEP
jgi:2-keto-4-pentenoate hydratase/2-oxohepta-3-ene-1,7-dioic acid hydratase in catechol pathway